MSLRGDPQRAEHADLDRPVPGGAVRTRSWRARLCRGGRLVLAAGAGGRGERLAGVSRGRGSWSRRCAGGYRGRRGGTEERERPAGVLGGGGRDGVVGDLTGLADQRGDRGEVA